MFGGVVLGVTDDRFQKILRATRAEDPLADGGRRFRRRSVHELADLDGGHLDVQVDAVEERPGDLAAIALDLRVGAAAVVTRIAEVAADVDARVKAAGLVGDRVFEGLTVGQRPRRGPGEGLRPRAGATDARPGDAAAALVSAVRVVDAGHAAPARAARRSARRAETRASIISRLGVRNSVNTVANASPPATDDASWVHHCELGAPIDTSRAIRLILTPRTIGISPTIVVTVVSKTGRRRIAQVRRTASNASLPRRRNTLYVSMKTMLLLTTMPASVMTPILLMMTPNGIPATRWPSRTPPVENTTAVRMSSAW